MSAYASSEKSAPPKISRIGSLLTNGWKKKLFSFVSITKEKKKKHTTKQQPLQQPLEETPTTVTAGETTSETTSGDEKSTEINNMELHYLKKDCHQKQVSSTLQKSPHYIKYLLALDQSLTYSQQ